MAVLQRTGGSYFNFEKAFWNIHGLLNVYTASSATGMLNKFITALQPSGTDRPPYMLPGTKTEKDGPTWFEKLRPTPIQACWKAPFHMLQPGNQLCDLLKCVTEATLTERLVLLTAIFMMPHFAEATSDECLAKLQMTQWSTFLESTLADISLNSGCDDRNVLQELLDFVDVVERQCKASKGSHLLRSPAVPS